MKFIVEADKKKDMVATQKLLYFLTFFANSQ